MTIIDAIDRLTKWLNTEVCEKLRFKEAPPPDRPDGKNYTHRLVKPRAWQIYKPAQDIAKYIGYDCPCVVVQPITIKLDPSTMAFDSMRVRLSFLTWSPGEHIEDVYDRETDVQQEFAHEIGTFIKRSRYNFQPSSDGCKVDDDGWRDCFNFLESTIFQMSQDTDINGLFIDRNAEVYASPYSEESVSQYFWPYHFAKLELTLSTHNKPLMGGKYSQYL